METFNQPTDDPETTDVVIGCHSVGNTGHGIGPSIAFFNPVRVEYELRPTNLLSIELFAYTAVPEWGGKKLRVPLEDDAILRKLSAPEAVDENFHLVLGDALRPQLEEVLSAERRRVPPHKVASFDDQAIAFEALAAQLS